MDPDYEQYGTAASSNTSDVDSDTKRISEILQTHITAEIDGLEGDICETDKRLNETRLLLDRLRAAMLISYYKRAESKSSQMLGSQGSQPGIHPAVKTEIGKSIRACQNPFMFYPVLEEKEKIKPNIGVKSSLPSKLQGGEARTQHRVIVGNVSKYIPVDTRQRNDQVGVHCRYYSI